MRACLPSKAACPSCPVLPGWWHCHQAPALLQSTCRCLGESLCVCLCAQVCTHKCAKHTLSFRFCSVQGPVLPGARRRLLLFPGAAQIQALWQLLCSWPGLQALHSLWPTQRGCEEAQHLPLDGCSAGGLGERHRHWLCGRMRRSVTWDKPGVGGWSWPCLGVGWRRDTGMQFQTHRFPF